MSETKKYTCNAKNKSCELICNKELAEIIYKQLDRDLPSKVSDGKVYSLENFKDYLINGNAESNEIFDSQLKSKRIILENKVFTKENKNILDRLHRVKFINNCKFEFNFIIFEDRLYFSENCSFTEKLTIRDCNTFDNNALFSMCNIKEVLFNTKEINIKVFDFCSIENLIANNIVFKKEVFFDSFNNYSIMKDIQKQSYENIYFTKCNFEKEFFIGQRARIDSLKFLSCSFFVS